jgi:hypothetical protein
MSEYVTGKVTVLEDAVDKMQIRYQAFQDKMDPEERLVVESAINDTI